MGRHVAALLLLLLACCSWAKLYRRSHHNHLDDWLTSEQKKEIKELDTGDNHEAVRDKIIEFYNQLDEDVRKSWDGKYKEKCAAWMKNVASEEELLELKALFESGQSETWQTKVKEYKQRLGETARSKVDLWENECRRLWNLPSRARRSGPNDDAAFKEFTSWTTVEQQAVLNELKNGGADHATIKAKVLEYFKALPEDQQKKVSGEFKDKCRLYFVKLANPDEIENLKKLHADNKLDEAKQIILNVIERQGDDVKPVAKKYQQVCEEVYEHKSKARRDINTLIDKHFSWMSPQQKEEVRKMQADGKSQAEMRDRIFQFLKESPSADKIRNDTRDSCYRWLKEVASPAEIDALHELHKTDHGACKTKVREYLARLPTNRQAEVEKSLPACEKIWYGDHGHDHHAHHHVKRDLSDGDEALLANIYKTFGFRKAVANEEHHELCRLKIRDLFGRTRERELKKLRDEEDWTPVELQQRIEEWIEEIEDPEERTRTQIALTHCKTFLGARRHRRDQNTKLEEALKGPHLSWLTDAQKAELKGLGADRKAVFAKIGEYYDALTGEAKEKATEAGKGACRALVKDVFGEEKATELKTLKESGAADADIEAKLKGWTDALEDPEKKETVALAGPGCKKVFSVSSRKRRDNTKLEEALKGPHLAWLTDEQKAELKGLGSDRKAVFTKIGEYYDALTGEAKDKATEAGKGACRALVKDVFGEEKATELKTLKESGAADADIEAKLKGWTDALTDPEKKETVAFAGPGCKKVFSVSSRRRRDLAKLEEAFKSHLSWTTDDQKAELRKLANDRRALFAKTQEYYEGLTGDAKDKATELFKGACRHFVKDVFGEEKANELKALKEAGSSAADIEAKVKEWTDALTDPAKKETVELAGPGCKKLLAPASRKRRDHHNEKLAEALKTHLSWLTDDQKEALKGLGHDRKAIFDKVNEFLDALTGDAKETAVESLKGGCRALIKDIFGDEKAAELKTLKESGATDQIEAKITEWTNALDDPAKKETVEFAGPGCKKLFKPARRFRRDQDTKDIKGRLSHALETHLAWLTPEQKESLKEFKGDKQLIYKKILEYYDTTTGETREKATEALQGGCRHYIKEILGDEKANEIKTLKESGATKEQLVSKVEGYISELAEGEKKERAQNALAGCKKVFGVSRKRRDHHEGHDTKDVKDRLSHALETHLKWLNEEQVKTVKELAGNKQKIFEKVLEWYDATTGDKRTEATEALKEGCRCIIKDVLGEEKANEIKALKEAGSTQAELSAKIDEWIEGIADADKKADAKRASGGCKKIFGVGASRRRRSHLDDAFTTHLKWLSDEQKTALRSIESDKKAIYDKVLEFYDATTGEKRTEATEALKGGCRAAVKELFGEEKANELKALKESGVSHDEIGAKVATWIEALDDPVKKERAQNTVTGCKRVFAAASRKRRDHHDKLTDLVKSHTSWLTAEQKAELQALGDDRKAVFAKIEEFYDALTGDPHEKAKEELKNGCRLLIKDIFGVEKAAELKALKEAGQAAEIEPKITEWSAAITDSQKKETFGIARRGCSKLFDYPKRKRRDHHNEKLAEALKTHLSWLTDDQKEALKGLGHDRKAIFVKVNEFLDALTGEAKEKAVESLKEGCRALIKDIFGEEKAAELKTLKESGAGEQIEAKITEWTNALDDPAKKETVEFAGPGCKKLFKPARFRRDESDESEEEQLERFRRDPSGKDSKDIKGRLAHALETHLAWLTAEQKESLKEFKGDKQLIYKKIMEFYETTTGETREKATESLQAGCRQYIKEILGEEKANEIKALKESGATNQQLVEKIEGYVNAIGDAEKKERAQNALAGCKKVFGVTRKRRDHHRHFHKKREISAKLAEALKTHLSWLNDDQKEVLKGLGEDRKAIFTKVQEFYDGLTGDAKDKATESIKNGCRGLVKDVFGEEKANELKTLKESGAADADIEAKVKAWSDALEDPAKKETVALAGPGCKKVFSTASRKRRDEDSQKKLAEALKTHLSWLTDDQKEVLKGLGTDRKAIFAKVQEFYDALTGDAKEKATEALKNGCRGLVKDVFGEEKANELKALKESGAAEADIEAKVKAWTDALDDPKKKETVSIVGPGCKKIFSPASRKRRDEDSQKKLAEALKTHLSWLNDDQKEVLKGLGTDRKAIFAKVQEFYDALTGDAKDKATESIKNGCRGLLKDVFGEEKANELKALKESGAADADIAAKVQAWTDALEDAGKKETVALAGPGCKKVFGAASRKRRGEDYLTEALKTHLSWLTDEQKDAVKDLGTDRKALYTKVMEFYEKTEGETRTKATESLQGGCRQYIKVLLGDEKAEEVKTLKESGATKEAIAAKIEGYIQEIEDPAKKERAQTALVGCKKLFGVGGSRKRRDEKDRLGEALKTHLAWLSDDQKEALKGLGNPKEIYKKVLEFYDATTGETREKATEALQGGCRHYIKEILGDEKAEEIKALKESGATKEQISDKIESFIGALDEGEKKERAHNALVGCKKVYGVSRMRRHGRAGRHRRGVTTFNEVLIANKAWMTQEEFTAINRARQEETEVSELVDQLEDIYEKTSGDRRTRASSRMRAVCHTALTEELGEKTLRTLDQLTRRAAVGSEMSEEVRNLFDQVGDAAGDLKKFQFICTEAYKDYHIPNANDN